MKNDKENYLGCLPYIIGVIGCAVIVFYMIRSEIELKHINDKIRQVEEQINESYTSKESIQNDTYTYKPSIVLTAKERDMIERVVATAARGESFEGMVGVASAIHNRVLEWDMSVTEVVTQTKPTRQFERPYKGEISQEVKDAVSLVFDQDGAINVLYYVNPDDAAKRDYKWFKKSLTYVTTVGGHEFYR